MPTYAYRCTACSHAFDIFQKFTDQPVSDCPECGHVVRKVFQPVGIVFKGSGWYINDSRKAATDSGKADGKPAARAGAPASDSSASPSPESSSGTPPATAKAAAD